MARPADQEFDRELESERGRWLRKRFLWFVAVMAILTLANLVVSLAYMSGAPMPRQEMMTTPLLVSGLVILLFSLGTYVASFIYVWKTKIGRDQVIWLALLLTIVLNTIGMAVQRIQYESMGSVASDEMVRNFDKEFARRRPTTATSQTGARRAQAERVRRIFAQVNGAWLWAFSSNFIILFAHLLPCLFIPWTLRESLRPAAALLLMNVVILMVDYLSGRLAPIFLWAIPLGLLAIAPRDTLVLVALQQVPQALSSPVHQLPL